MKSGRWCPLGCGKCVIAKGWSNNITGWRCIRCGCEFKDKEDLEP